MVSLELGDITQKLMHVTDASMDVPIVLLIMTIALLARKDGTSIEMVWLAPELLWVLQLLFSHSQLLLLSSLSSLVFALASFDLLEIAILFIYFFFPEYIFAKISKIGNEVNSKNLT